MKLEDEDRGVTWTRTEFEEIGGGENELYGGRSMPHFPDNLSTGSTVDVILHRRFGLVWRKQRALKLKIRKLAYTLKDEDRVGKI